MDLSLIARAFLSDWNAKRQCLVTECEQNVAANVQSSNPASEMNGEASSPVAVARALLARCGSGTLATAGADGYPFASLVSTAPEAGGAPLLLLSRLAVHTRNLERDPRASLLLADSEEGTLDPLARSRLTVTGAVEQAVDQASARAVFIGRHPQAARYAGFADFAVYRLAPSSFYLVAGFGHIAELDAAAVLTEPLQHPRRVDD
jgi:putative heme iron utilization protein